MATIQQQRDNLTIGLDLANWDYANLGLPTLDVVLERSLGYNHNGGDSSSYPEPFERRFRAAQRVGRDAYRARIPGYFTFNAMAFAGKFIYKATWYVWINPNTHRPQPVPLPSGDLSPMRLLRDRDLDTRQATNRSIRAAHNIHEQKQAIARQDTRSIEAIQSRMIEDGSANEIITGIHGIPYADIHEIIPQLADRPGWFHFQTVAKDVVELRKRLIERENYIADQVLKLAMIQSDLPPNAPNLALQQAQHRLDELP